MNARLRREQERNLVRVWFGPTAKILSFKTHIRRRRRTKKPCSLHSWVEQNLFSTFTSLFRCVYSVKSEKQWKENSSSGWTCNWHLKLVWRLCSKFWRLSKCPECHDQASKRNTSQETTYAEDREEHKTCYHPNPLSSHLWRLTDSFLCRPTAGTSPLVLWPGQYCVTSWPLGTVRPERMVIKGTPLWKDKFPLVSTLSNGHGQQLLQDWMTINQWHTPLPYCTVACFICVGVLMHILQHFRDAIS